MHLLQFNPDLKQIDTDFFTIYADLSQFSTAFITI